jgi:hypothetical protein
VIAVDAAPQQVHVSLSLQIKCTIDSNQQSLLVEEW